MRNELEIRANDHLLWRRLAKFARPKWPHLAGIVVLSVFATPLAILVPLPLKIAVDSVLGKRAVPDWLVRLAPWSATLSKTSVLALAAGLLLAISILMSAQSLASWLLQTYTGEKLVHDLRGLLLWHSQRLSLAFHDRRGSNDTSYRIQYDAPAIQGILIQGLVPLISAVVGFCAMLYVTTRISWPLATIALILSPVLFLLARHSSRKVRVGHDEIRELDSSAMLVLNEALASVRAVKAFGQEGFEDDLFRRKSRVRMSEQVRLAFIQATFHVLIGLTIAIGTAAALFVGVSQVQAGTITVGEFLLVMAYMAQLYEPLRMISTKIPELQSSIVSAQRAFALLDEVPELGDSGTTKGSVVRGDITFESVSFQYAASVRRVLHDVTFAIPAGKRVGIIGPSGSGKSTLVNLLTRFYDPTEGRIRLDGIDLRNYKLADLRSYFSIVLQDPMLFSTTIAGNIAYGRPNASRSEVIQAAKLANADDFIRILPLGYDTPIGDKGVRLSGGERQRIALARAFLKDAPFLILDEPTSAVDIRAESVIMDATRKLMEHRTTFMIAHRLSTVQACDLILVLKAGRLVLLTSDLSEAATHLVDKTPEQATIARAGLELVH